MLHMLIDTFKQWIKRDPLTYSASTAYYAVFSMPGLLIITVYIAALIFDRQTAENQILSYMQHIAGPHIAETVQKIIETAQATDRSIWTVIFGTITLLFGATGVFVQLQRSLNHIWEVEIKKSAPILDFLKNRATAFGLVISIGFLLLVSLSLTAILGLITDRFSYYFSAYTFIFAYVLHFIVSITIISFLFALIFKVLPDVHLKWRHVIQGGIISALLFSAGEYGLGLYFQLAKPETAFGTAGSIILFMLWISYSCLVLLFGAEFTKTAFSLDEKPIKPTSIAKKE